MSAEPKSKRLRPSLQPDSIDLDKPHVPRTQKVDEIMAVATRKGRVILGGTPATGKSSLLELLMRRVEQNGDQVIQEDMFNDIKFIQNFMETLEEDHGIAIGARNRSEKAFASRKNKLWILLDDAQKAYSDVFGNFWTFFFKTLPKWNLRGKLIIVVASTYDETLGASPVTFELVNHVTPHASYDEALAIYELYTCAWRNTKSWEDFRNDLLIVSCLAKSRVELNSDTIMDDEEGEDSDDEEGENNNNYNRNEDEYHIGVIMAAMWFLSLRYKKTTYTEDNARCDLRKGTFLKNLERCYQKPIELPIAERDRILDMLLLANQSSEEVKVSHPSYHLVRRGLLNKYGDFACLAAHWYYNSLSFPGRALESPASLDSLVLNAVKTFSQRRLQASRNGTDFPKEAAFQQLFNEAANRFLPAWNSLTPELNTKAILNGKTVEGEMDFYVNSRLNWAVELLKGGKQDIGDHLKRFRNGRYREVETSDYLVVDFRGPLTRSVGSNPNCCTFFFAEDFGSCKCKMRDNNGLEEFALSA